jgi:hypothetical protein
LGQTWHGTSEHTRYANHHFPMGAVWE